MKICRFQPLLFSPAELGRSGTGLRPEPRYATIAGESVREISGELFGSWVETDRTWPLAQVKLLPPVTPGKIVCLARNFREHAIELGHTIPTQPLIFLKTPTAVIGPDEPIVLPRLSLRVDYEGELAVVIGRTCSQLAPEEDTRPYWLGFTCMNDVTARDLQQADVQFTRAKGFDTFCPLGPLIETELDLGNATIETYVNGARRQAARATEMIFSIDAIISWISRLMTLEPGDVIATGTPSGAGALHAGDVVEVVVSGIGTLRNSLLAQEC